MKLLSEYKRYEFGFLQLLMDRRVKPGDDGGVYGCIVTSSHLQSSTRDRTLVVR
jgi:hypothetical protein